MAAQFIAEGGRKAPRRKRGTPLKKRIESAASKQRMEWHYNSGVAGAKQAQANNDICELIGQAQFRLANGDRPAAIAAIEQAERKLGIIPGRNWRDS